MTKKDFIAIADALKGQRGINEDQWSRDTMAVGAVLQASNPAFNMLRWLAYVQGGCGPNGGKV